MPYDVGKLQKSVQKGDTKIVCLWTVEDFLSTIQAGDSLCSKGFHFGPGRWHLFIGSKTVSSNVRAVVVVELTGPYEYDPRFKGRISWNITVLDIKRKSAKGMWKGADGGECEYCLPLGPLLDVRRFLHPYSSLKVLCELRIIADVSSQTETHLGDPEITGTLQSNVRCTKKSWIIPEFRVNAQRKRRLSSRSFEFGTRLWQLHISPHTSDVSLSLESASGSGAPFQFSWKFSVENDRGDVLKRTDGMCEGVEEPLDVTLHLGPLPDVQGFIQHGTLRVQCELQLPDEITDTHSSDETEAGTDALARDYEKLLSSGEATDATVSVRGQREFLVHRAVLVARTPVFASMFRHRMSESETGVVDIEDCNPDIFHCFLHFVYTGSVEDLRPEEAMELYQVADKYQVDELKSRCLKCVRAGLGIETFCPTISLALQHYERELIEQATEFFADNVDDIVLTVQWQEFLAKNPTEANELFVKALRKKKAVFESLSKNSIQANDKL